MRGRMGWIRIALSAGRRLGPQGTPDGQIDSHQYGRRRRESVSLWDSFTVSLPVFNITKSSNSSRSLLPLRLFLRVRLTLVFTERHHDAPHSFTSSVRPSSLSKRARETEETHKRSGGCQRSAGRGGGFDAVLHEYGDRGGARTSPLLAPLLSPSPQTRLSGRSFLLLLSA